MNGRIDKRMDETHGSTTLHRTYIYLLLPSPPSPPCFITAALPLLAAAPSPAGAASRRSHRHGRPRPCSAPPRVGTAPPGPVSLRHSGAARPCTALPREAAPPPGRGRGPSSLPGPAPAARSPPQGFVFVGLLLQTPPSSFSFATQMCCFCPGSLQGVQPRELGATWGLSKLHYIFVLDVFCKKKKTQQTRAYQAADPLWRGDTALGEHAAHLGVAVQKSAPPCIALLVFVSSDPFWLY